ncbi:ATP-dependent DNA helicase RecG [Chloroflexota bacterium]
MTSTLNTESLRKILDLEHSKNYDDSAVFGGLDRFLQNWAGQATESITDPLMLRHFRKLNLAGTTYALLNRQQRKDWVKDILEFLDGNEKTSGLGKKKFQNTPLVKHASTKKDNKKAAAGQTIDSSIIIIKGVSSSLAAKFAKLEVRTVRDLLYFFPNRHLDYSQRRKISQLAEGKEETVIANVWQAQEIRLGGRRSTEAIVGDETGNVRIVWFNNPYLAKQLVTNARIVISGRVTLFKGRHVFESPEWELLESEELIHTGRLVPVYPLTRGLGSRQVRKLMKGMVDLWAERMEDFLSSEIKERCRLLELSRAISQAHYPEDEIIKDRARVRLAFDELFLLQLGVLGKKRIWQRGQDSNPFHIDTPALDIFIKSLPFTLTTAQQKVLKEMLSDLEKPQPMSRLLQGEVGSGKTVIAMAALIAAAANGYQGAFMAPTEILAEQHFATVVKMLNEVARPENDGSVYTFYGLLPHAFTVALLIGDVIQSKKEELQQRIASGEIDIIIGTHALIQKGVEYKKLGLVVVDEQHRFGVAQRSALRQKGFSPHVLVMTATPIPRTLALTLYGDLDLSVIDELPPGRQTVKTKWLKPDQRTSAYAFIRKQVVDGRQAFILCPLVEESEAIQARAAVAEYEKLSKEIFSDLKLGLLHGRMSSEEKDKVMRRFRSGEFNILVSTPVIEVGIDIPNATVMMVESADRFGLSQLHQFRGRVGRGSQQSYCMLLAQNPSLVAKERLDLIENIQNGFQLAEEDLKLRGPGEFFGTRQSGLPDLRMAHLSDVALLEMARQEAIKLFDADPTLKKPGNQLLAKELVRVWPKEGSEWS